jgi:hypothetical protein
MATQQIPKVIHCVWLSGDKKPRLIQDCLDSWKRVMPDYEIREWGMADVEKINSRFLHGAIAVRKWAFATDFLRVWILYHYGGIYMDLDVYVYQKFDKFLGHRAFSGIEFWAPESYKTLKTKQIKGLGIDAAMLGAEVGHPWIKDILSFYDDKEFINDSKFFMNIVMPNVIADVSKKYGFRYVPSFQMLNEGVHLYPNDVFSAVYDKSALGLNDKEDYYTLLGDMNTIRCSCHLCANSWGYIQPRSNAFEKIKYLFKRAVLFVLGEKIVKFIKTKYNKNIY